MATTVRSQSSLTVHVHVLVHVLLFLIITLLITAALFVRADGRLDRVVTEENLGVLVQVIEAFGLGPVQPIKREENSDEYEVITAGHRVFFHGK